MLPRRIRPAELSPGRVGAALGRRLADLPHRAAWRRGAAAEANRRRLGAYRDRHAGQRCFVLGNGPSLAKTDLAPLRDEVTFGANRVYLLADERGFLPSYYCATNALVLRQFAADIAGLPMPRFLGWSERRRFRGARGETLFVRTGLGLRDRFVGDPRETLSSGGTVTFVALQLAFFMGFSEVVLLGVDHDFAESGIPNRTAVRSDEIDRSHCHPDYFPPGARWQLPDLHRSQLAYALARDAFAAAGRRVVDATEGGRLEVFEKVRLASLFEA